MSNVAGGDQKLLDGVTSDTDGGAVDFKGGMIQFSTESSNFGGGTVTLEHKPPGFSNWLTAVDVNGNNITLTANGMALARLGTGKLRATLTNATTPSAVTARVDSVFERTH